MFDRLSWASGIGPDGRPKLLAAYNPPAEGTTLCPYAEPTNWGATAFSPVTHHFYLMALEQCHFVWPQHLGTPAVPTREEPSQKYLRALDIDTGEIVWDVPQIGTTESKHWSGVLATTGGLIFYGDPGGDFIAADERNGNALWHFPSNDVIKASPMTYTAAGKQFVAVAAGSNVIAFGLR